MKNNLLFYILLFFACSCEDATPPNVDIQQGGKTRSLSQKENVIFKCVPGTEEWAKLEGIQSLKDNSQIREEILYGLSDEELAQALLEYPLAYHYTAYENERAFIDEAIASFNGLAELSKRPSGFRAIVNCYKGISYEPEDLPGRKYTKSTSFNLGFLELILSNGKMLERASVEDMDILKETALSVYKMKLAHPEYFGLLSVKRSLMLCASIAIKMDRAKTDKDCQTLKEFINSYSLPSVNDELTSLSEMLMSVLN